MDTTLLATAALLLLIRSESVAGQFSGGGVCDAGSQQAIGNCANELKQLGVFTSTGGSPDALTWEQIRRRSRQYFSNICDGGGVCDAGSQQAIGNCANELKQLGVFTSTGGSPDALTWEQIRRRSRQYFSNICDSYKRFNQCVERGNYKALCWMVEPVKAQYAVADAALDYVCGQGYYGMLNNWDCFLQAATRSDIISCEARILQDARGGNYADLRQGERACTVLGEYMDCIRDPIFEQCGSDAWRQVKEAVQRPTQVYLPYCTLASSSLTPSLLATLLLLLAALSQ